MFLERITSDALNDRGGSVSVEGWIFINFRITDYIVVNAEDEEEVVGIVIFTSMDTTQYRIQGGDWWLSKRNQ